MNCGLCRDCKWWDEYDVAIVGYSNLAAGSGHCQLITDRKKARYFAKALLHGDKHSYLVTVPDFGCVQFEVKA